MSSVSLDLRRALVTLRAVPDLSDTPVRYHATPLQNGLLAIECIILFGTLVQLGIAVVSLPRTRSPHLVPWIATVAALVFITIAYALDIAFVIVSNTVDAFGSSRISWQASLRLSVTDTLFTSWTESLVLAAVALFVRDRYLAYSVDRVQPRSFNVSNPLVSFVVISSILFSLMFSLPIAYEAVWANAYTSLFHATSIDAFNAFDRLINVSNDIFFVYVGIYILVTIFLVGFAFVVRKLASPDRITQLILITVIPLLSLRAISRLVFLIVEARLPLRRSFIPMDQAIITLSSNLVLGLLYLFTTGVLVYCLMFPQLWVGPSEHLLLHDVSDTKALDGSQGVDSTRASPPR